MLALALVLVLVLLYLCARCTVCNRNPGNKRLTAHCVLIENLDVPDQIHIRALAYC